MIYHPAKISYDNLLIVFWPNTEPTVEDRQFCDEGNQYRTVIFYHDEKQRRWTEQSQVAMEQTKPSK